MKKKEQHITQSIPSPMERARVRLKICGMKHQDNIKSIADLHPDYLGFIFHQQSVRHFEGIIPKLPKSIKKVGVFVNKDLAFVKEKIEIHQLNAVQLHGNESPEFCKDLRHYDSCPFERSRKLNNLVQASKENGAQNILQNFNNGSTLEIIKVFSIKNEFDFDNLKPYEDVCDYFLFDTKGKLPGGNGYTFNWDVLKNYPSSKPFFLSGGIGLDQIEKLKAFKKSEASKHCYAIDVNSKFEFEPGLKNIELLKEFKERIQQF